MDYLLFWSVGTYAVPSVCLQRIRHLNPPYTRGANRTATRFIRVEEWAVLAQPMAQTEQPLETTLWAGS